MEARVVKNQHGDFTIQTRRWFWPFWIVFIYAEPEGSFGIRAKSEKEAWDEFCEILSFCNKDEWTPL
ncbi:MAG: hypothetical protein DRN30_00785 [Thermoplasmata archaeon]|nr:MAG: hypothetical protein DRN30_00785 [Thermoplasmata archaeon]